MLLLKSLSVTNQIIAMLDRKAQHAHIVPKMLANAIIRMVFPLSDDVILALLGNILLRQKILFGIIVLKHHN